MNEIDETPEGERIGRPARGGANGGETPTETLVAAVEDGADLHDSLMRLASRGWTEAQLYELMDESAARVADPERWQKRRDDVPRLVASAAKKQAKRAEQVFGAASDGAAPSDPGDAPTFTLTRPVTLPRMTAGDMSKRQVKPRRWLVEPLIPEGEPCLLYGKGAAGKSLALLQLAICVTGGRQWLGKDVPKGRVLFFTCEDSSDELTRRASDILEKLGASWDDLGDRLLIVPMRESDDDATLVGENLQPTGTYDALKAMCDDFKPDVLIIDTLADTFAGDELKRAQAKRFIKMAMKLARNATQIVTAHLSISAEADERGFSGSTGWPAAVRANLTFGRPRSKDDKLNKLGDVRVIATTKANYSAEGAGVLVMRYEAGAFVAVAEGVADTPDADVDALFLTILDKFTRAQRYVTERQAPGEFAKDAAAKTAGLGKKDFEQALARLFDAKRIINEEYRGANSAKKMRLHAVNLTLGDGP